LPDFNQMWILSTIFVDVLNKKNSRKFVSGIRTADGRTDGRTDGQTDTERGT
jgi:hypothetical protein